MDDYRLALLILKNTARLEKLISSEADYSKILKQSKKTDNFNTQKMVRQIERKTIAST